MNVVKDWWKYGVMFLLMVVTGYGNAVMNDGSSWVWSLMGSTGGAALWHGVAEVMVRYEAKHKG